ncbi:molybdopterin molybdenumtransferase MoeA [Romboutsia maritimum]|uniref:Molybdopterin molybdenumtransferase n=1 Tax=Romboutsia maritimum TaxID=2020948 RepID=A0A371ISD4_9FIRM|nr:molybdopterin molybdotransferase MoeA [Romboutsia maritimum]RDY23373.1 molybdopterin molybdenumtransferase MoeA [Romboutsia maritimum]
MIELEEAIEIIKENVKKIKRVKTCNIIDAINKVSVEDVYSPIDSPPFDRSPYDGYTYNSDIDTNKLKVVGTVFAGEIFKKKLDKNEAVKIMTGAKIPKEANCVIKKEDVDIIDEYIILNKKLNKHDNYIFKGEDINKGQLIINKGCTISVEDIGVLASLGIHEILVYDDIKVGILITGTEIQDLHEILMDGKIYDSNKYILNSKLKKMDINNVVVDKASDDLLELEEKVRSIIKRVDCLITTGGVSVGDKDLIPKAFKELGAKELFWRVNVKPGGACYSAILEEKLLLGLSGNPHAALIVFDNILIPAIEYITNKEKNHKIKAIFKGEFNKKSKKDRFIRAKLFTENAKLYVKMTDNKDAKARLYATLNSNCMIKVNKGTTLTDNQMVEVVTF